MNKMTELTVPLNCLSVSELNVRRTPTDGSADAELKASLAAHGLLQNLVVHKGELNGHYTVGAGRRRLTLLKELAFEGVIGEEFPVPCLLVEDDSLAVELSIVENMMRADMHIADEVEAFARLVRDGSTIAEIAVRFGMSERTVEKRLRLGNVSPVLLQAYRDGEIILETLMAFTLSSDQKLQEDIWTNLSETRGFVGERTVRGILLEGRIRGNERVAAFVGIDAYELAGGRVTRDLFADEDSSGIWLEDPQVAHDLADRKLSEVAEGLKESWKWAEFDLDFGWEEEGKFNKAHPVKGELTSDEEAQREDVTERRQVILRAGVSDETRAEYTELSQRIQYLRDLKISRNTYTDEQRAIAGCVVTLDYSGDIKVIEGLVRDEDMPAATRASGGSTGMNAEEQARVKAGYSKKLMDEMRSERTQIVRSYLFGAFTEAFDLLLFQMAREVFSVERYFSRALDIELFRDGRRYGATDLVDIETLSIDWLKEVDDDVAFEKMRSLSDEEKRALFAACVATTYKGQLTIDTGLSPEVELIVDDLNIDFATGFRPTAENFWGRLTKARILAVAEETLGEEWADAHSGDKKAVLAKAMEVAFTAGDEVPEGVSPEGRASALAWTPSGFLAE